MVPGLVARALVEPEDNGIPLRVLNPRDIQVQITKGTILAELESSSIISTATQQCNETEPTEDHIGTNKLRGLLAQNTTCYLLQESRI